MARFTRYHVIGPERDRSRWQDKDIMQMQHMTKHYKSRDPSDRRNVLLLGVSAYFEPESITSGIYTLDS